MSRSAHDDGAEPSETRPLAAVDHHDRSTENDKSHRLPGGFGQGRLVSSNADESSNQTVQIKQSESDNSNVLGFFALTARGDVELDGLTLIERTVARA